MNIVSDTSANAYEKIERAAHVLRASKQNKEVFQIVYSGSRFKTLEDIKNKIGKFNTNTYKAAKRLYGEDIIDKKTIKGVIYYGKITFYATNRDKILKLSKNAKKLAAYPTKRKLRILNTKFSTVLNFPSKPKVKQIYVNEIDSFNLISKNNPSKNYKLFCRILNQGDKKDWGGERNDIFTNNIYFGGKRKSAVFALKGKATQGDLTPGKMGKNGDQIQRLFEGTSDLHFIGYHSEINERTIDLMQSLALAKSIREDRKIYFCLIDGRDLSRLVDAYPKEFGF